MSCRHSSHTNLSSSAEHNDAISATGETRHRGRSSRQRKRPKRLSSPSLLTNFGSTREKDQPRASPGATKIWWNDDIILKNANVVLRDIKSSIKWRKVTLSDDISNDSNEEHTNTAPESNHDTINAAVSSCTERENDEFVSKLALKNINGKCDEVESGRLDDRLRTFNLEQETDLDTTGDEEHDEHGESDNDTGDFKDDDGKAEVEKNATEATVHTVVDDAVIETAVPSDEETAKKNGDPNSFVECKSKRAPKKTKKTKGGDFPDPNIELKPEDIKHTCVACKKGFAAMDHIIKHRCLSPMNADGQFPCPVCGKCYRLKTTMQGHVRRHLGDKPHKCDLCPKRFLSRCLLVNHMRTHSGEKPFLCQTCGKCFGSDNSFRKHVKIHTGIKDHQCPHCPKRFYESDALTAHLRSHTGEKPFGCLECGRRFGYHGHLKDHMRIHTKEKPYACDQCTATFSRRTNFKRHLKIHQGVKQHSCPVCQHSFVQKAALVEHIRKHTGERPFECPICSRRFAYSNNAVSHIANNHRNWTPKPVPIRHTEPLTTLEMLQEMCATGKLEELKNTSKEVAKKDRTIAVRTGFVDSASAQQATVYCSGETQTIYIISNEVEEGNVKTDGEEDVDVFYVKVKGDTPDLGKAELVPLTDTEISNLDDCIATIKVPKPDRDIGKSKEWEDNSIIPVGNDKTSPVPDTPDTIGLQHPTEAPDSSQPVVGSHTDVTCETIIKTEPHLDMSNQQQQLDSPDGKSAVGALHDHELYTGNQHCTQADGSCSEVKHEQSMPPFKQDTDASDVDPHKSEVTVCINISNPSDTRETGPLDTYATSGDKDLSSPLPDYSVEHGDIKILDLCDEFVEPPSVEDTSGTQGNLVENSATELPCISSRVDTPLIEDPVPQIVESQPIQGTVSAFVDEGTSSPLPEIEVQAEGALVAGEVMAALDPGDQYIMIPWQGDVTGQLVSQEYIVLTGPQAQYEMSETAFLQETLVDSGQANIVECVDMPFIEYEDNSMA